MKTILGIREEKGDGKSRKQKSVNKFIGRKKDLKKELFEEVGGFDPEIFWGYAAEDQFFWEKINTISEVSYADNPIINMFL